ncbi:MAG: hypothetical protein GTN78_10795, partial [Gemmatimonadales bacterium]|nr:hypothetical protein [Gemmatimonadales bacterium]
MSPHGFQYVLGIATIDLRAFLDTGKLGPLIVVDLPDDDVPIAGQDEAVGFDRRRMVDEPELCVVGPFQLG